MKSKRKNAWPYLWRFLSLAVLNLWLIGILENWPSIIHSSSNMFLDKKYIHAMSNGYNGSHADFIINNLINDAVFNLVIILIFVAAIFGIVGFLKDTVLIIKKITQKIRPISLFFSLLFSLFILSGCSLKAQEQNTLSPNQISDLETRAEKGDTAALHRLIEYYDENSIVEVEVDAAWDSYGNPIDLNEAMDESSVDDEFTNHCAERLDYWLTKGIAMNDPMAFAVKGYNLYYTDENEAIPYLAKAAEMGDGRAALFCGSACMNQEKYEEAVEFLQKAYNLNVPSAGWHLSMLYVAGLGVPPNREKAIDYLRHSAILNYPEAVLEMKRIEPQNPVWSHKADSLKIDFQDFPIIPD